MYTNMDRVDHTSFEKASYKVTYKCTTKTGLVSYYWFSELTQAALFHNHEMGKHDFTDHSTSLKNKDLFDDSTDHDYSIFKFVTVGGMSWDENVVSSQGSPLAVTKA